MGMNYYLKLKGVYGSDLIKKLPEPENEDMRVQELTNGYVWNNKYYPLISDLNSEYYFPLHIGKNSSGWVFGLRVMPKSGINNLEDWKKLFDLPEAEIINEENDPITKETMIAIITTKSASGWKDGMTEEEYEKSVVDNWNKLYDEAEAEENRNPLYINFYSRRVKDYNDYLSLKDFGEHGALKGPRGLIRRRGSSYYPVINVDGASYDLIVEDDNYGW